MCLGTTLKILLKKNSEVHSELSNETTKDVTPAAKAALASSKPALAGCTRGARHAKSSIQTEAVNAARKVRIQFILT